jgi:hypothetical protein
VRDRREAHLALEAELLDVVEKKNARPGHGATGAALRLRLVEELEERLVATLGRQAESLDRLVADMRLVTSAVDRAYAGMIAYVVLKDVRDVDSRMKQVHEYQRHGREAVRRTWQDGGPVFTLDEKVEDQRADGRLTCDRSSFAPEIPQREVRLRLVPAGSAPTSTRTARSTHARPRDRAPRTQRGDPRAVPGPRSRVPEAASVRSERRAEWDDPREGDTGSMRDRLVTSGGRTPVDHGLHARARALRAELRARGTRNS